MGETTGGEPTEGVRASDAERDATVERLSQATGEGRLALEEFSQRMERATTARTRAELDRLVTDLPASGAAAGAVTVGSSAAPSWHVSPIGGLNVFGPWRMGRHVIVVTLVGGARLDLSQAELAAPEVTLTKVSLVGGVRVRVPSGIRVEASGLTLVGGTRVEGAPDPGPGAPTIHIRAFSLVGGIRIDATGQAAGRRPNGSTGERTGGPSGTNGWPTGARSGGRGAAGTGACNTLPCRRIMGYSRAPPARSGPGNRRRDKPIWWPRGSVEPRSASALELLQRPVSCLVPVQGWLTSKRPAQSAGDPALVLSINPMG